MLRRSVSDTLRTAVTLQRRDVRSALLSPGMYVTLALALATAHFVLSGYGNLTTRNSVLVLDDPLYLPIYLAAMLFSVYLGLTAAVSIARERDQGTFEVLFFAPVSFRAYVLGRFLAPVTTYTILGLVYGLALLLQALAFNLRAAQSAWLALALTLPLVGAVVAFGLFLSATCGRVRPAILLFVAFVAAFLGIQVLADAYGGGGDVSILGTVLRSVLDTLTLGTQVLSPYAYLARGMEAAAVGDISAYAVTVLGSLVYTGVLLTATVWVLRRRGVAV